jgi:methyltransferase (TIGR00027 family)
VSLTAVVNAFLRAHHAIHERPPIFDDALAGALFSPEEQATLAGHMITALAVFDPDAAALGLAPAVALARSLRAQSTALLLARARLVEDRLARAIAAGVAQYVILGAGLDTFAFRRPDLRDRLRVFELDHPATQADKRQRMARAGWATPDHLRLVPIDFTTGDLGAALDAAGHDPRLPTFHAWMGVTYYLDRAVLFGVLQALAARSAPGSVVAFDHLDPAALDDTVASARLRRIRALVARVGEPMKTGLDPVALPAALAEVGWTIEEALAPAALEARYFAERDDGYHALEHFHVVVAARAA